MLDSFDHHLAIFVRRPGTHTTASRMSEWRSDHATTVAQGSLRCQFRKHSLPQFSLFFKMQDECLGCRQTKPSSELFHRNTFGRSTGSRVHIHRCMSTQLSTRPFCTLILRNARGQYLAVWIKTQTFSCETRITCQDITGSKVLGKVDDRRRCGLPSLSRRDT